MFLSIVFALGLEGCWFEPWSNPSDLLSISLLISEPLHVINWREDWNAPYQDNLSGAY